MPQFHYKGRDAQGKLVEGKKESKTEDGLAGQLLSENIIPLEITLIKDTAKGWREILLAHSKTKVKLDELLIFSQQMQTLIQSGIPVIGAISRIAETLPSGNFKRVLLSLAEDIAAGQPLSVAMLNYPQAFPPVMLNLIKVGEESGNLEYTFGQIAAYFDLEEQTTRRIKTAFRYPFTVVFLIAIAFIIINVFVIPRFAQLFASFKVPLPWPTLIIISISNFIHNYWDFLLIGIVFTVMFLSQYLRT